MYALRDGTAPVLRYMFNDIMDLIYSVAFPAVSRFLASGSDDKEVRAYSFYNTTSDAVSGVILISFLFLCSPCSSWTLPALRVRSTSSQSFSAPSPGLRRVLHVGRRELLEVSFVYGFSFP